MHYCVAKYKQNVDEKIYRIYMSDLMKVVCERAAGVSINKRYIEIMDPHRKDTRSCEEITADIVSRCGLEVRNEST